MSVGVFLLLLLFCFIDASSIVIKPFRIHVADEQLEALNARISNPVLPRLEESWSFGTPVKFMRVLLDYWRREYQWKETESQLNKLPMFTLENGNRTLHFLHYKSGSKKPTLLFLHGWPGGFFEFQQVIPHFIDEYNVVVPSLPGYAWSSRSAGDDIWVAASLFSSLVVDVLGYREYFVQGGDWGAIMAPMLCERDTHCKGVHVNFVPFGLPFSKGIGGFFFSLRALLFTSFTFGPSQEEIDIGSNMLNVAHFLDTTGYLHIQATRPLTIAYGLRDSPVALAAYLVEKVKAWTDVFNEEDELRVPLKQVLDMVHVYYFSESIGSSMAFYRETLHDLSKMMDMQKQVYTKPFGYSSFPDLTRCALAALKYHFADIRYYTTNVFAQHFPAWQEPEFFAKEVKAFLRVMEIGESTKLTKTKIKQQEL